MRHAIWEPSLETSYHTGHVARYLQFEFSRNGVNHSLTMGMINIVDLRLVESTDVEPAEAELMGMEGQLCPDWKVVQPDPSVCNISFLSSMLQVTVLLFGLHISQVIFFSSFQ